MPSVNAPSQPWNEGSTVSPELARALVASQWPDLADAPARILGQGWDNTAILIGDWVFRFPRRHDTIELIEAEIRVSPGLAPLLPIPISAPQRIGTPTDQFPYPFAGYPILPGTPSHEADLSPADRAHLAPRLAEFLRVLHSTPAPLDISKDPIDRHNFDHRIDMVKDLLTRASLSPLVSLCDCDPVFDAIPTDFTPSTTTLVHGDLRPPHLLIEHGTLSGVIDWGDLHRGDPATDLAIAWTFLPPGAHTAFRNVYPNVSDTHWAVARFRALHSSLVVIDYAESIGDPALRADALRSTRDVLGG